MREHLRVHEALGNDACLLSRHLRVACEVGHRAVPDFCDIGEFVLVHRLNQPVDELHSAEALAIHLALVAPFVRLRQGAKRIELTIAHIHMHRRTNINPELNTNLQGGAEKV